MTLTPAGPCGARSSGPRPEDGKSRCNASPHSSTPAKLVALHEQPRRRLSKLCCITLFFFSLCVFVQLQSPRLFLFLASASPPPPALLLRTPSLSLKCGGGLTETPMPHGLARISPASSRGHMDPPPCTRKRIVCLPDRNARSGAGGGGGGRVGAGRLRRGARTERSGAFSRVRRATQSREKAQKKKGRSGPNT